ncbi:MAG: CHAT domain-containing protein [Acidimicrobiia bacterium]|nr:CHAT domain-containing protein [Acidimicrobiia bacterium]
MLHATITVDASTSLRDLISRIGGESDALLVTIRRVESGDIYWYVFPVGQLRGIASDAASGVLDASLTEALGLQESQAVEAFPSSSARDLSNEQGVLVRGSQVVGVLRPTPVAMSAPRAPSPPPPRTLDPGGLVSANGPDNGPDNGEDAEADERRSFTAYPALGAPESVASREAFELFIGLSSDPVPGVSGGPIVAVVPEAFRFDIQVVADGFELANGGRAVLEVVRDRFEESSTSITVIAPDVSGDKGFFGLLEVFFYFEGNICGRAVKAIAVGSEGAVAPMADATGASPIKVPTVPAPDLTVTVSRGREDTRLVWSFATGGHLTVGAPTPVAVEFDNDDARTFALDRVRKLAHWDKSSLSAAHFQGVAEEISRAMPVEFWTALDAVWEERAEQPSVLIVSEDPYVPWELALTSSDYVRTSRLDPSRPPFLGAQVRVGRWIPPVPTPFGGEIPVLPPVMSIDVDEMVLFVGDYAANQRIRPLPMALEEGEELARRYLALKLSADSDDVTDLIDDTVRRDGKKVKVDAVHFACHGEMGNNPEYNGIVLSDRDLRLSADMIAGSKIGETSQPFVFLNACQLGLETEDLDGSYGGMAGAFLDQGASGFVAPLWNVDDDVARDFALDFYEGVFGAGLPVSEMLGRLRSRFSMTSSSPRASYLAYVYFGHPELVIHKKGARDGES